MRTADKIVLASNNVGKFREFEALLKPFTSAHLVPVEGLLRNSEKLGLVETHHTYLENAIAKARLVNQGCHYPALSDDTGIEIEALSGKPGVTSHRYAKMPGASKQAQSQANRELVLTELKGKPSRRARFVTVVALLIEGILIHAEGMLEGQIAETPKGDHGFGYDSIFIPEGATKTLAEMTEYEKNALSHRARAVEALFQRIRERRIVLAKP